MILKEWREERMKLDQVMDDFITLAIQSGGWMELDRLYLKNRILSMIDGKTPNSEYEITYESESANSLSNALVDYATKKADSMAEEAAQGCLKAQLLDLLTPPPSVVNAFFAQHYSKSPEEATDYFYTLNKRNSYIKSPKIERSYSHETSYGTFLLQIKADKASSESERETLSMVGNKQKYPKCVYCFENEGFCEEGTTALPSRRLIRMNVGGESWGFQFAQYEEFKEKFIVSSELHQGLNLDKNSMARMAQLLDIFPQYFVSLSKEGMMEHGYYVGGKEDFPIAQVGIAQYIELKEFPLMNVGALAWPFPTIRLQSPNAEDIIDGIDYILKMWRQNQKTDRMSIPTILGRKKDNLYEFDILFVENEESGNHSEQATITDYLGTLSLEQKRFEEMMNSSSISWEESAKKILKQYVESLAARTLFGKGMLVQEEFQAFLLNLE